METGVGFHRLMKKRRKIKFIRDIPLEELHLYKFAFSREVKNEKKDIKDDGRK